MGGNLFSEKRIGLDEFDEIKRDVLSKISELKVAKVPRFFNDKKDFGDLDVCVVDPNLTTEEIKTLFKIGDEDIHWNTSVASIRHHGFQVDLCFFPALDFRTAVDYMSFGDLSNMVGVIFNQAFGMRFTHRGLIYAVKTSQENLLGEVLISKDTLGILKFADLDHKQWEKGFNNEEEAFEWISRSKYFNSKFFEFESLNHQNRTRNRKRAMYSRFVEWCKGRVFENNYDPKDKRFHLWRAAEALDSTLWMYGVMDMINERVKDKKTSEIFNGSDVARLTGLTGWNLGNVWTHFKQFLDNGRPDDWKRQIRNMGSKERAEKYFMSWYDRREN